MVDSSFKLLRKHFRTNGKFIIDHVKRNHFDPWNIANEEEMCSFCGNKEDLTKEHVLPRWVFQNNPDKNFLTKINNQTQALMKTYIPACATCNNDTLSEIERYISNLFDKTDLPSDYYQYHETLNIIRWLEIIEYKFHVLEFRRKFRRNRSGEYIPILRDVPVSVMRRNIDLSPYKALAQLRKAQARVRRKKKDSRYEALVIYKLKEKDNRLLFFHSMDKYIFIQIPEYQLSLFYFFNQEFKDNFESEKQARKIILNVYG